MHKQYSDKQIDAITPVTNAHVVGTRFPKDFYYRKHRLPFVRFTLCMPDGMICSIQVFEGENADNKIRTFIDNWYEVTKRDPELFDHFKIKDKCPVCGGEMMCHILERGDMVWCLNYPNCHYFEAEEGLKTRERIAFKHGLRFTIVQKTGATIMNVNKKAPEEWLNPDVESDDNVPK